LLFHAYFHSSGDFQQLWCFYLAILTKATDLGIGNGLNHTLGDVVSFEAEIGKGVKCTVDNDVTVHIGNRRCLDANGINVTPGK